MPNKTRTKRGKKHRTKRGRNLAGSTPGSSPEKGAGQECSDRDKGNRDDEPDAGGAGTDTPAGGNAADADVRGKAAGGRRCAQLSCDSGGPALQAPPTASADASTDSRKATKRKLSKVTVSVAALESVKSRLDFGEQGRLNASSLELKCGAEPFVLNSGQVVVGVASGRNERKLTGIPTSSGDISDKARRARMKSSEEPRGAYHNISARTHRECFSFGGCKCGGIPAGASASVTVPGHSAADSGSVQNQGTEQAAGGAAGEEEPGTPLSSNGAAARGGGLKGHITVEDHQQVAICVKCA